ncbi:cytoplasmic dynein 1 intermediate chain-like [Episyrphus balteatus]|uniref:cytoplasmic dynein 1 intermediate chain-like n=1 Tax=Episyrphus balteatus TaxID=286459 RepID=UPI0024868CB2|nr:cytoplasmic dynein 1 intermediate chain-like [Episyrphus balteatus]
MQTMCYRSHPMASFAHGDTLELQPRQSNPIAISCMSFPSNEINNLVMGSEDGNVYYAYRHGIRSGVSEVYEKHLGPVTGISTHPNQSTTDFGDLFLTSSIDWTIKLWSLKDTKPSYSFEENSNYVMVSNSSRLVRFCRRQWSP